MILNSKILEEVKKRRGKPSPVNIYQRLVLLVGAAALVFAIWTSPASMPAVGVIGTTLLIFFVLKDSKEKQDKGKKVDPRVTDSEIRENEDMREMLPEGKENRDLQEMLCEPEKKERTEEVV